MKSLTFLLLVVIALLLTDNSKTATDTTDKGVRLEWNVVDSKAYARDKLSEWQEEQWSCLNRLWGKESAWNPLAVNGSHYGIPQGKSEYLKTLNGYEQIQWGLDYIGHRYGEPCVAWDHFKRKGWH